MSCYASKKTNISIFPYPFYEHSYALPELEQIWIPSCKNYKCISLQANGEIDRLKMFLVWRNPIVVLHSSQPSHYSCSCTHLPPCPNFKPDTQNTQISMKFVMKMKTVLQRERGRERGGRAYEWKRGEWGISCSKKEMCGGIFGYYLAANTIRTLEHGSEVAFCQFKREGLPHNLLFLI